MRLGLVTYNLAKDWDVATIIANCSAAGFAGVELRTTHAHKVEVDLTPEKRREVRARFADSPVQLVMIGTAFEFQSHDPAVVQKNIDGTKRAIELAHDVGAIGVKVRPNGVPDPKHKIPLASTLKQIGQSLAECGEFGKRYGIDVRLEVHGAVTQLLPNVRTILEQASHDKVSVCWNSNPTDLVAGSLDASFKMVERWVRHAHIHDLYDDYPYRRLFSLLRGNGYQGYTMAEIPESADALRLMRFYSALWRELAGA